MHPVLTNRTLHVGGEKKDPCHREEKKDPWICDFSAEAQNLGQVSKKTPPMILVMVFGCLLVFGTLQGEKNRFLIFRIEGSDLQGGCEHVTAGCENRQKTCFFEIKPKKSPIHFLKIRYSESAQFFTSDGKFLVVENQRGVPIQEGQSPKMGV